MKRTVDARSSARELGSACDPRRRSKPGLVVLLSALCLFGARSAAAQDAPPDEVQAGEVRTEQVDSTRLDVSRLPPEAIEVTRDLYAHGFFAEAQLGAQGFLGDLGDVSKPGPRLALDFGY